MNWAQRRKLTYILIVLVFFGAIGYTIYHKATDIAPTCFDHKKNGDETGVDCGGGCTAYCANEIPNPVVQWVRIFPVTPGIVEAIAYVQHGNPVAAAQNVQYEFKLYDAQNNLLADKAGTTFLGTAGKSAIVESLIPIPAGATVTVARFTFNGVIPWQKVSPSFSQIVIDSSQASTESFDGGTRLTAVLKNRSRFNFLDMETTAIFYDKDGNAISASKVVVPTLGALQSKTVYFTWPYAINNIARIEIIPRFNPFTSQSL